MRLWLRSCVAMFSVLLFFGAVASADPVVIHSGPPWLDATGAKINAHGAGILQVGDTHYWFGESRLGMGPSQAINCYRSKDLKCWEPRGAVFFAAAAGPELRDINLERPKVLFNQSTRKFVLFAHRERAGDYKLARILIAACDTVDGQYKYVADFNPLGNESRDMTVFREDDGTTYLFGSANANADLAVYNLAPII